jgi:hypothetical protein
VVSDNFSWQNGGGIWCNVSPNSMLLNNIIAHNDAEIGGGVYVAGGALNLLHDTIVTNVAELGSGGAVYANSNAQVAATNCILWRNGSNDTANVSVQYSLVDPSGGTTGAGNFTNDPKFVSHSLQDYHIHNDSPARAAGSPSSAYDDIDGESRPLPNQTPDVGADHYLDANGNEMADSWERFYSFGGLFDLSDPDGDADEDGFTNLDEFNAGTNPVEPDPEGAGGSSMMSPLFSGTSCWVCTNLPPTPAGLTLGTVTAGSNYSYQAYGCIQFQGGSVPQYADPDGNISHDSCATFGFTPPSGGGFVCPGLKTISLVGKINGANCFQMGSSGSFTASASGTLTVYVNDNYWPDNSGS